MRTHRIECRATVAGVLASCVGSVLLLLWSVIGSRRFVPSGCRRIGMAAIR